MDFWSFAYHMLWCEGVVEGFVMGEITETPLCVGGTVKKDV